MYFFIIYNPINERSRKKVRDGDKNRLKTTCLNI